MPVVRRSLTVVAVAATALALLTPGASADNPAPPSVVKLGVALPTPPAVARGLIIKTTTSTPSKSVLKAADSAVGSEADAVKNKPLTGKISTISFDQTVPESVAEDAAVQVAKRSDVVWAVPDTLRHSAAAPPVAPNDTFFKSQTNLWDSASTSPVGGYSVKAPALWRSTKGSPDVVVAVVDTGIVKDHTEISAQLVDGYDMIGADQDRNGNPLPGSFKTAGDGNGRDSDPSDPGDWTTANECGAHEPAENSSWHGTFIAGMIAARTDNAAGIAGIAPAVKVEPVRVLGHCGGWDSDIVAGVTWASGGDVEGVPHNEHPAQVINLSLGGLYSSSSAGQAALAEICKMYGDTFAAANSRNSLVVAAAGNEADSADRDAPASCPNVISVGATSKRGFRSWYSNRGRSVDISAPGGDSVLEGASDSILSLVNRGKHGPIAAEDGGDSYARYEGTSMSTAEVSAGAALLYSTGLNNPDQVQDALYASAAPFRSKSTSYSKKKLKIGSHTHTYDLNCNGHAWCGHGILDLSRVLASAATPTIEALGSRPTVGETVHMKSVWNGQPTSVDYQWYRDGTLIPEASGPDYTVSPGDEGALLSATASAHETPFRDVTTATATTGGPVRPHNAITMSLDKTDFAYGPGDFTVHLALDNMSCAAGTSVRLVTGDTVVAETALPCAPLSDLTFPQLAFHAATYDLRAEFVTSDPAVGSARSAAQTVTVHKAVSSLKITPPSHPKKGKAATVDVHVYVVGIADKRGTVTAYDGSTKLATIKMVSGHNQATLRFRRPHVKAGTHKIKVVYSGTADVAGVTGRISYKAK